MDFTYRDIPIKYPLSRLSTYQKQVLKVYLDSLLDLEDGSIRDRLCVEAGPEVERALPYVVAALSYMDHVNKETRRIGPLIIGCSTRRYIEEVTASIKTYLEFNASVPGSISHGGIVLPDMEHACLNNNSIKLAKYNTCTQRKAKAMVQDIEECPFHTCFARECENESLDVHNKFYSILELNVLWGRKKICPYYMTRYVMDKAHENDVRYSMQQEKIDIIVCYDEMLMSPTKTFELFEFLNIGDAPPARPKGDGVKEEEIEAEEPVKNVKPKPLIIFYKYQSKRIYESFLTRNDLQGALSEIIQIKEVIDNYNTITDVTKLDSLDNELLEVDFKSAISREIVHFSKSVRSSILKDTDEEARFSFYETGPKFETPIYFINMVYRQAHPEHDKVLGEGREKTIEMKGDPSINQMFPPLGLIPGSVLDMLSLIDFLRIVIEVLKGRMKVCNTNKLITSKTVVSKFINERNSNLGNTKSSSSNEGSSVMNNTYFENTIQNNEQILKYYEDGVITAEFVETLIDDINCICTQQEVNYPLQYSSAQSQASLGSYGFNSKIFSIPHFNFLAISRALASIPYRLNGFVFQYYLLSADPSAIRSIKTEDLDVKHLLNLSEFVGTLGLAGMASYYTYKNKVNMDINVTELSGDKQNNEGSLLVNQNIIPPPSFLLLYSYPPYVIQNKTMKEPKFLGKQSCRIVFNEMRNNIKAFDSGEIKKPSHLTNAPVLSYFELILISSYHVVFDNYSLSSFKNTYMNKRFSLAELPLTSYKNEDEILSNKRDPALEDKKIVVKGENGSHPTKSKRANKPRVFIVDHGSDQTMITLHPAHLTSQLYTSQETSIFKNLGLLILSTSKFIANGIVVILPSEAVLHHAFQMWADMGLLDALIPCVFVSTEEYRDEITKGFLSSVVSGRNGILLTTMENGIDIPKIERKQESDRPIDLVGALLIMGIPYSSRLPAHTALYLSSTRYKNIVYSNTNIIDLCPNELEVITTEAADKIANLAGSVLNTNPSCIVLLTDCRYLNTKNNKYCVTAKFPMWFKNSLFDEVQGTSNEGVAKLLNAINENVKAK